MKKNLSTADKLAIKQPTGNTIGLDLGDRWSRYCVLDVLQLENVATVSS